MVFCDDCTAGRLLIHPAEVVFPPDWDSPLVDFDPREPQRCCEVCAASLLPRQHELQQTTSNAASGQSWQSVRSRLPTLLVPAECSMAFSCVVTGKKSCCAAVMVPFVAGCIE